MGKRQETKRPAISADLKRFIESRARVTAKQLAADRVRRNRAFARMTPAQRRVTVAKDVLSMLDGGKINAKAGTYWGTDCAVPAKNVKTGAEFSDVLARIPRCNACAIGSLFMGAVYRADNLKLVKFDIDGVENYNEDGVRVTFGSTSLGRDTWFGMDTREYLVEQGFFSDEQLTLMENAFECTFVSLDMGSDKRDLSLDVIGDRCYDADRLRLIMENVVRNRGTFKPRDSVMKRAAHEIAAAGRP